MPGTPPPPRSDPAVTVAVMAGGPAEALEAAAAAYPGGAVRVEALPETRYEREVRAALLGGLDRYDLVLLPASSLGRWQQARALRPIGELLKTESPADDPNLAPWLAALAGAEDEPLLALPTRPDPLVLWYRSDLIAAGELPRGWDGLPAVLETARAPGTSGEAVRGGLAFAGGETEAGITFAAALASMGGTLTGADGRAVTVNSPQGRAALGLLVELGAAEPGATGWGADQAARALQQGRAVMALAPLSAYAELTDCADEAAQRGPTCAGEQPLLAWAWLPGMGGEEAGGGEDAGEASPTGELSAWAVPLNAPNAGAAARFAAWLSGAEGARVLAENGWLPAHRGVLGQVVDPRLAAVERYTLYLPPVPVIEQLWGPLHSATHAAITGEQAVDEALAEMQEALEEEMRRVE